MKNTTELWFTRQQANPEVGGTLACYWLWLLELCFLRRDSANVQFDHQQWKFLFVVSYSLLPTDFPWLLAGHGAESPSSP